MPRVPNLEFDMKLKRGMTKILIGVCMTLMLTSCDFVKNAFTHKDKTQEFVETVIQQKYDESITLLAMDHGTAPEPNLEQLKVALSNFRAGIIENFGTELKFTYMRSEKTFSTKEENNTPPNTTEAFIQIANDKEFGILKVLFDDVSGKILKVDTLDVKEPIPSMTTFWLFGLLALCVPVFNIYAIWVVTRSDAKKKWLKYIAIFVLNVPTIAYSPIAGLTYSLLNFQILAGVGFAYMGYMGASWSFGIPLAGLYWIWRIKSKQNTQRETPYAEHETRNSEH